MWGKWRNPAPSNDDPHPAKGARRVLIVDDDPIIRRLVTEMLALEGIETECLSCGEDLRAKIRNGEAAPEVLLLDLSLPDDMGEHLLDLARKHWKTTCFILCTGHI